MVDLNSQMDSAMDLSSDKKSAFTSPNIFGKMK